LPRFVTSDGRTVVDLITLSATGSGRDGQWFRITCNGWFYAEVRTCTALGQLVDLAELREVLVRTLRRGLLSLRW
jgi:hypothetical protein